MTSGTVTIVQS